MPTIGRIDQLRIVVWPNDHRPAHVHVIGPDSEAVFNLNCPEGPAELRESFGFRLSELRRIEAALSNRLGALCVSWKEIHDRF
jgi:hypothetical protein